MRAGDKALLAIEAAYAPVDDESRWLSGIAEALEGLGFGPWCGYVIDGKSFGGLTGEFGVARQQMLDAQRRTPETLLRVGHAPAPPVETGRRRWTRIGAQFGLTLADVEATWGYAMPKATALFGTDARGRGAFLAIAREIEFASRTKHTLAGVAAHVNAAYRLRLRLRKEAPEAICAPEGKMLDGSRSAVRMRAPLSVAVKTMDRARGKLRRVSAERAVALWSAMVEGRWSLVDRTERDGKRLVLAYRNEPTTNVASLRGAEGRVATLAALGHSNKYIAYELGLRQSTVATHLRRALTKLRVGTRQELVEFYGPLARLSALE